MFRGAKIVAQQDGDDMAICRTHTIFLLCCPRTEQHLFAHTHAKSNRPKNVYTDNSTHAKPQWVCVCVFVAIPECGHISQSLDDDCKRVCVCIPRRALFDSASSRVPHTHTVCAKSTRRLTNSLLYLGKMFVMMCIFIKLNRFY